MRSESKIQIGHQVLRDLSSRFSQIEDQFELLEWVDSQGSSLDLKLETYITTLAQSLQGLAKARRSGIFTFINGGIIDARQLFTRPALRLSPYKTSAKGIYICSSSTPPGGGVHGMCGYHAAKKALKNVFNIQAPPIH